MSTSDYFIYRHQWTRVQPYVPREASFPIPLKYIDVTRATSTSLDVMLEKSIDDNWNGIEIENWKIRGQGSLGSWNWTKNHQMDVHGPGRDWQESKRSPDQTLCGQIFGKYVGCKKIALCLFRWYPAYEKFKEIMNDARRKLEVPMPAAMPCRTRREEYSETCSVLDKCKTKYAYSVWKELHTKIMKIILQGGESTTTILCTSFFRCLMRCKDQMRKQQWRENGKTWKDAGMAADESQEQKRSDRWMKQGMNAKQHMCVNGSMTSRKFGVGVTVSWTIELFPEVT